jgi:hypothetical protein
MRALGNRHASAIPRRETTHLSRHKKPERVLHSIACTGVLVFLAAVALEHVIDAALDPAQHEISEYVYGPAGALMTVGFRAWAIALGATGALAGLRCHARWLATLLGVAAAGMVVTACSPTQTSAGRLPPGTALDLTGRLHDAGSGATSLAMLAAALLSFWKLRGAQPDLRSAPTRSPRGAVAHVAIGSDRQ